MKFLFRIMVTAVRANVSNGYYWSSSSFDEVDRKFFTIIICGTATLIMIAHWMSILVSNVHRVLKKSSMRSKRCYQEKRNDFRWWGLTMSITTTSVKTTAITTTTSTIIISNIIISTTNIVKSLSSSSWLPVIINSLSLLFISSSTSMFSIAISAVFVPVIKTSN